MAENAQGAGTTVTVHTLAEAMNAPPPRVVVIDRDYQENNQEKLPSTTEDLWVSSADGRYSSPPVPIRVGPLNNMQTFYVHRDILIQAEWFRKALCGDFREANDQVIDLPEEDPAIFHFLVTFLYEGQPAVDKGKGLDIDINLEPEPAEASDSSSTSSVSPSGSSDSSGPAWRRRRQNRQARNTEAEGDHKKHPGYHRPGCPCPRCLARRDFSKCWQCGARRSRAGALAHSRHGRGAPGRGVVPAPRMYPPGAGLPVSPQVQTERITGEDLRTWFMAYELNLDVYICANRFLMDDFQKAVMRSCVDMLETAGWDAAQPEMLYLCRKLYRGVPEVDDLLKMVMARVGFLQPLLWKRTPEETSEFLIGHPELAATILRETVVRHSQPTADLPSMEHRHGMAYEDEWRHMGLAPARLRNYRE
ncbi:hypothetical protein F66182_7420 [Fusarium sp. NRRL 66182]|nr:hypothetical protein F66182_7420 [Fusarium sp. NRRL 66182]